MQIIVYKKQNTFTFNYRFALISAFLSLSLTVLLSFDYWVLLLVVVSSGHLIYITNSFCMRAI